MDPDDVADVDAALPAADEGIAEVVPATGAALPVVAEAVVP